MRCVRLKSTSIIFLYGWIHLDTHTPTCPRTCIVHHHVVSPPPVPTHGRPEGAEDTDDDADLEVNDPHRMLDINLDLPLGDTETLPSLTHHVAKSLTREEAADLEKQKQRDARRAAKKAKADKKNGVVSEDKKKKKHKKEKKEKKDKTGGDGGNLLDLDGGEAKSSSASPAPVAVAATVVDDAFDPLATPPGTGWYGMECGVATVLGGVLRLVAWCVNSYVVVGALLWYTASGTNNTRVALVPSV